MSLHSPPSSPVKAVPVNRYDRLEWAGAFGDLGTLMPFVIAYVSVMKLDAFGVLFGFGVSMVVCGWVYKTPFPVQPMKAAGAVATTQAAQSAVITPGAVYELQEVRPQLRWPTWAWPAIGWNDIVLGTLFLALPQVPLTLANAIIGVREENNRLFPDRPVTDRQVAVSTGVMNVFGSAIGGVPMCHGAGGMAGHVAFGARTGGSLVILGGLLLMLALGFSASVVALFEVIPPAVLGTILFMTGVQLASGQFDQGRQGHESTVLLVTAGLSMWNVGIGFGVGLLLQILLLSKTSRV